MMTDGSSVIRGSIPHFPCDGCGKDVTEVVDNGEAKISALVVTHPTNPTIRICGECAYEAALMLKTMLRNSHE